MKPARAPSPQRRRARPVKATPRRRSARVVVRLIPADIEDARVWDDVADALELALDKAGK